MKKVQNVVFYKFYGEQGEMQQACLFYDDGTVAPVTVEEAIDATYEIAKEEKIKTKEDLKAMFNKNRVHLLSGEELQKRYQEFVVKPVKKEEVAVSLTPVHNNQTVVVQPTPSVTTKPTVKRTVTPKTAPAQRAIVTPVVVKPKVVEPKTTAEKVEEKHQRTVTPVVIPTPVVKEQAPTTTTPVVEPKIAEPVQETTVTPVVVAATVTPPKKKNIFQRTAEKLKKNKVVRNIALGVTALAIALGGYSCGARNTKEGKIINPFNRPAITSTMLDETGEEYISLLRSTKNETQRAAMEHASFLMDNFNTRFANAYIEEGKDIKPALTWDEMMALNLAYNDYSKEEIAAMFNGADLDAEELSHAYRNGTLQLMGAYVIAERENPVNSYLFLRNEEHQNFVKKYEDLFYNCKEAATEDEMIAAVNAFYAELYKDFPIADEVREQGISHGESRRQLQPYKLAVTPIVAASEIMFQNLEIDHTLSDKAIAYFNDLGLCNMADQAFEKAMYISLATEEDKRNPSYYEFKTTKIEELLAEDSYGVADAERDLSQLDRFKYWVNGGYFERFGDRYIVSTHTVTSTHTWTERHETRTDDRDEAVERAGEEAVKRAEEAVDKQIEQENAAAKEEGEKQAEQNRQEMQEEADKEAEEIRQEIEQSNQDLQDKIEDANQTIENGGTVNEDDFGDHNVDFDEEHSDSNGNLDDSVTDITTDGTGAVDSSDPLPDPNADEFDYEASSYQEYVAPAAESAAEVAGSTVEVESSSTYENTSGQEIYEYEEELTNEQLVDAYIQELEQGSYEEEASYTK